MWRPILRGELEKEAGLALDAIAADILSLVPEKQRFADAESLRLNATLSGGFAGIGLFFFYLHRLRPNDRYDIVAAKLLEQAIEMAGESDTPEGLYVGFAGVAWVLEHLREAVVDREEDLGEEVAAVLNEYLAQSPWHGDYDLIRGLVGYGVYALERLPLRGGKECLESVVARLSELAERRGMGVCWRTAPQWLTGSQSGRFPNGNYNAGVAHGTPGVIALLAAAYMAGANPSEARALAKGAVQWLLAQELPQGSNSLFPYLVAAEVAPASSRLAWCYGDLGIAATLLVAARAFAEPAWEAKASEIARSAAARTLESTGIIDAGLCHGSAGLAHLFGRLYQACDVPLLEKASLRWFRHTLEQRSPGHGIGGFLTYGPDYTGTPCWHKDPGFLTGAAGVGLALIAGLSPIEPEWDRLLLLSYSSRLQEV